MYIRKVRNRIGKKVRIFKHAGKVRKLPFLYLIARLRSTASFARFSSFNISLAGCLTFCAAKCILVNDEDVLIQIWRDRISKQLQMEPIKASFFAHVQCTLEVLRGQTSYSCNKITKTWIQISRQNWFGIFSNISHRWHFD